MVHERSAMQIERRPTHEVPALENAPGAHVAVGGNGQRIEATTDGDHRQRRGSTGERELPWKAGKWANLAQAVTNHGTVREAMRASGLDWDVKKVPVYTLTMSPNGVGYTEVPRFHAIAREDNERVLGITGNVWRPWQNREMAEFADVLIDASKSSQSGMGEIKGGQQVFVSVKLDNDLTPPGLPDEQTDAYMIMTNGHNGGTSATLGVWAFKWACVNGLLAIVPGVTHVFKIRHTKTMHTRIDEAGKILAQTHAYLEDYQELMDQLLGIQMGTDVKAFAEELLPIPKNLSGEKLRRAERKQVRRRRSLERWFERTDTIDHGLLSTGYGVLQTVVEWRQWAQEENKRRRLTQMERMINQPADPVVLRARNLVLARR